MAGTSGKTDSLGAARKTKGSSQKTKGYTNQDVLSGVSSTPAPDYVSFQKQNLAQKIDQQKQQKEQEKQQQRQQAIKNAHSSVSYKLTHNPVTDAVGGAVKDPSKAAKDVGKFAKDTVVSTAQAAEHAANTLSPVAQGTSAAINKQQQQALKAVQSNPKVPAAKKSELASKLSQAQDKQSQQTFGYKASDTTGKKIEKSAGNVLQTASLALPGAGKVAEKVVSKVAPKLAERITEKMASKTVAGAATRAAKGTVDQAPAGATFGAGQAMSEGKNAKDVAKSAAAGAAFTAGAGAAGSLAKTGVDAAKVPLGKDKGVKKLISDQKTSQVTDKVKGRMSLGKTAVDGEAPAVAAETAIQPLVQEKAKLQRLKIEHPNQPQVDEAMTEVDKKMAEVSATATKDAEQTQKTNDKNDAEVKKIDQQTEVIKAKAKDSGKTSAVDKVKLKQLDERKQELTATKEPSLKVNNPESATTGTQGAPETLKKDNSVITVVNTKTGEKSLYTPRTQAEHDVLVKKIDNSGTKSVAGLPDKNGNIFHATASNPSFLKKGGYKEVPELPKSEHFTPEAPKVSNRKQKEYNPNSDKPVTVVPIKETPVKTPDIGQSKLAGSTEQKAIDKKLTQGFEGKPEYAKVNTADQAKAALELHKTDPEKATRIALGKELPPEGLLPESVYTAVENRALKNGDVDLLRRLATESSLSSEATSMGQRIRMLGERDPDSAVSKMRQVAEAKKKAFEKKAKTTANKAVKKTTNELKQIREKTRPTTRTDWNTFVESIKCS